MLESRHCGLRCRSGEIGRRKGLKIRLTDGFKALLEAYQPGSQEPCCREISRQYPQSSPKTGHVTPLVQCFLDRADSGIVCTHAAVAESAYARDLKSRGSKGRSGSSPDSRTNLDSLAEAMTSPTRRNISITSGLPTGIGKRGPVYQGAI